MKDVPADTPFIFFYRFICVSPLQDFVGVMSTLISPLDMIAHPVPALLRPQCLMTQVQGHCSGKLPGRTGGKRFFAARTGLSIHIIVSMRAAKAACCTDVRQFHLSNISRCAGVRATRMSSCAKNCDNVTPKASQIFSSDANDGVIDFLYHEEMVDCGRPERSAS